VSEGTSFCQAGERNRVSAGGNRYRAVLFAFRATRVSIIEPKSISAWSESSKSHSASPNGDFQSSRRMIPDALRNHSHASRGQFLSDENRTEDDEKRERERERKIGGRCRRSDKIMFLRYLGALTV